MGKREMLDNGNLSAKDDKEKMKVDVIGVPIDLGASRRGVDMGPSAIRYAGLRRQLLEMGLDYRDKGNIPVDVIDYDEESPRRPRHIEQINRVNEMLADQVSKSLQEGCFPVVLGGDHSIAVGTILGVQREFKNIGIIWMDAHGDFNSLESSITGNLHGMSLAASTGRGAAELTSFRSTDTPFVDPEKVVIVGARSIDKEEGRLLLESGVTIFTISDIDMYGMRCIMEKAIRIAGEGTSGYHVSFDMDVLNPNEAPGVGTPVYGGLTYREAHLASEMIAEDGRILSLEMVEVNPILDQRNQTSEIAVSLVCSLLGKQIIKRSG
jgi:arginase